MAYRVLINIWKKKSSTPKDDRKKKIQGRVVVQFVVERDGSITDIKIIEHVSPGIDQEATRVFQNSPKWMPGTQYGFPVRAQFTQAITFALPDNY